MYDQLCQDTIVALATPPGASLVGIVRLSGAEALSIVSQVFCPDREDSLTRPASYLALTGKLRLGAEYLSASLYLMRAPYSYTKEDVAEFHLIGSPVLLSLAVEECLKQGARLASRGEFTKRALLNGRIDLNQAEAVLKIIQAEDADASKLAVRDLEGGFSRYIKALSQRLFRMVVQLEAAIDFSDQDIELFDPAEMLGRLDALRDALATLAAEGKVSRVHRGEVKLAICGRPNVGKSSLFNVLLDADKAIVTSIPGTTRDVLEGELPLDGLKVMLFDSAGMSQAASALEEHMLAHANALIEEADLILLAVDSSEALTEQDRRLFTQVKDRPMIPVLTKADLPRKLSAAELGEVSGAKEVLITSALTGEGILALREAIHEAISTGKVERRSARFLLNLRQQEALRQAAHHLSQARDAFRQGLGEEFVALDLREALDSLGEVSGEVTSEDILDQIFSHFCVGK